MGSGSSRLVKARGLPHGQGGDTDTGHGPARSINFPRMRRGTAQPITLSTFQTRPGPAHFIFEFLGPARFRSAQRPRSLKMTILPYFEVSQYGTLGISSVINLFTVCCFHITPLFISNYIGTPDVYPDVQS